MNTVIKEPITTVYNADGKTVDVTLNLENLTDNDVNNACAAVNDLMNEHFNITMPIRKPYQLKQKSRQP